MTPLPDIPVVFSKCNPGGMQVQPRQTHANSASREAALHEAREWLACIRLSRLLSWTASPPPRSHDFVYAASGFRAESRCRLAEGKAGQERHATGFPPVLLCRNRQDH